MIKLCTDKRKIHEILESNKEKPHTSRMDLSTKSLSIFRFLILGILCILYFKLISIRVSIAPFSASSASWLFAMLSACISIIFHELLHAITLSPQNTVYVFFINKGFTTYFMKPISKPRCLFMMIFPFCVLSLLPLFLSFAISNGFWVTFLLVYSLANAGLSYVDIAHFILVLLKVPKSHHILMDRNDLLIL